MTPDRDSYAHTLTPLARRLIDAVRAHNRDTVDEVLAEARTLPRPPEVLEPDAALAVVVAALAAADTYCAGPECLPFFLATRRAA